LLRTASPAALGSLQDYLESLSDGFEALRLAGSNQPDFDEGVIKSIGAFTPYRDEYLSVLGSLVRTPLSEDLVLALKRFFERLIPFLTRPPQLMSWSDHWFDNYGFIIHELFLYTVAVLIKHERFAEVSAFLGDGFYAAPRSMMMTTMMASPSAAGTGLPNSLALRSLNRTKSRPTLNGCKTFSTLSRLRISAGINGCTCSACCGALIACTPIIRSASRLAVMTW
jgi:hypothetical protein